MTTKPTPELREAFRGYRRATRRTEFLERRSEEAQRRAKEAVEAYYEAWGAMTSALEAMGLELDDSDDRSEALVLDGHVIFLEAAASKGGEPRNVARVLPLRGGKGAFRA